MSHNYGEQLKKKYAELPEIKRISKSRKVPKTIKTATQTKRIMLESEKKKTENRRIHGKENIPYKAERNAIVLSQEK